MSGAAINVYKVPARRWKKWTPAQQGVFNGVYMAMFEQDIFKHPKDMKRPPEFWDTIRWNAAFTAASEAEGLR